MNREEIFTDIIDKNKWSYSSEEKKISLSGEGSSLQSTINIRKYLPELFKKYNIQSIIDAPCGDYYWFKEINMDLYTYTGIDIVKSLIDSNNNLYQKSNIKFEHKDLCKSEIIKADLILCRDCLIHLSDEDSFKVLKNFKNSGSKYLLITTNYENPCNLNISTGSFRHLNMQVSPFNFPPPLELIPENNTYFKDKSLGLWKLEDIKIN